MKTISGARRICCAFGQFIENGLALLMVAVTSACANTTGNEGTFPQVVLYGSVRSSTGVPVAGATVVIGHHPSRCGAGAAEIPRTTTNSAGRYREPLTVFTSADGCVRIIVTAAGFAPDSVTLTSVPSRQPPALDSVETNFVLAGR